MNLRSLENRLEKIEAALEDLADGYGLEAQRRRAAEFAEEMAQRIDEGENVPEGWAGTYYDPQAGTFSPRPGAQSFIAGVLPREDGLPGRSMIEVCFVPTFDVDACETLADCEAMAATLENALNAGRLPVELAEGIADRITDRIRELGGAKIATIQRVSDGDSR